MSYAVDRRWGDELIPAAVRLIAPHVIVPADAKRDQLEATDLVVLHTADGGIAFRTRRSGWEHRFGDQFTVRYSRPSGATTEFEKIMSGYASWMFYGWAKGNQFTRWMLLDLDVFRWTIETCPELVQPIANKDGTEFCAFSIHQFPQELVIDQSPEEAHELAA